MEHLLMDGEEKIPYSAEAAKRFQGYLATQGEEVLYRKYALHPVKAAFM